MGFWKVLGGVAVGIGTVAALPIAGPVGAVTAVGAAIAGTVGAAGGGIASVIDDEEKKAAYREGKKSAKAKEILKVQKIENALKDVMQKLKDDKSYFQLIIALFAVGMATANADGEVTEEELTELNEFVGGVASSNYPPHVKRVIAQLKNEPPSFYTAMEYVKIVGGDVDMNLFEDVIELVAYSDGHFCRDEKALLEAFKRTVA